MDRMMYTFSDILSRQGGWASLANKVFNKKQSYFLKIYEKSNIEKYS